MSVEDQLSALMENYTQLQAENKRLNELMERHRICVICGKQLSEAECKTGHTCYDEQAKGE